MSAEDTGETKQFLTFRLADEVFAFEISKVREVLDFTTMTKVPLTPGFMRGVINLRGAAVPVVDLRHTFGMPATERTADTCIIITEVLVDNETTMLGALADSVQEVLELDPAQIEPPPKIGSGLRADVIRGMGKRNGQFIIILDIDKLFFPGGVFAQPAGQVRRKNAGSSVTAAGRIHPQFEFIASTPPISGVLTPAGRVSLCPRNAPKTILSS